MQERENDFYFIKYAKEFSDQKILQTSIEKIFLAAKDAENKGNYCSAAGLYLFGSGLSSDPIFKISAARCYEKLPSIYMQAIASSLYLSAAEKTNNVEFLYSAFNIEFTPKSLFSILDKIYTFHLKNKEDAIAIMIKRIDLVSDDDHKGYFWYFIAPKIDSSSDAFEKAASYFTDFNLPLAADSYIRASDHSDSSEDKIKYILLAISTLSLNTDSFSISKNQTQIENLKQKLKSFGESF